MQERDNARTTVGELSLAACGNHCSGQHRNCRGSPICVGLEKTRKQRGNGSAKLYSRCLASYVSRQRKCKVVLPLPRFLPLISEPINVGEPRDCFGVGSGDFSKKRLSELFLHSCVRYPTVTRWLAASSSLFRVPTMSLCALDVLLRPSRQGVDAYEPPQALGARVTTASSLAVAITSAGVSQSDCLAAKATCWPYSSYVIGCESWQRNI